MTEQIKFLQDPKTLSNQALWHVILNVFPETVHGKEELRDSVRKWYKEIEKEFSTRNVILKPITEIA